MKSMSATLGSSKTSACSLSRPQPAARAHRTVVVAAAASGQGRPTAARRQAIALLLAAAPAWAALPAVAAYDMTPKVCADQETGEQADACRARVLSKDVGKQQEYSAVANTEGRAAKVAINVPVSKIDDEYTAATLKLADNLESYFTMDVYDKARVPLIKDVKVGAQAWVTKYARGGSVRKQSARRFYIAVDSVLGHMASNGLAPFPASKAKTVRSSIDEARTLLAEAK